ncbi:hypothetical protein [Streptomyces sp. NPDC057429]|uniref:hypothetical protein n=1 Tax=Streptomyces sp. NPDC057429 TaxID=3346130 RepID=UPI0036B40E77
MRVRGSCPNCRTDRLLPGLDTAGNSICRDCASITRDFFCDRCGFEGLLLGGRLCERCTLADTLARLLDDGTGQVALPLQPLVTTLLKMDRPKSWLFPGRQPGQPMNPVSLQVHLRKIGVPPQRGRTSAIRQLVLQAPAPVIAKALGYHDKTATRLVTEAGGTWSRYAPGDHTR